MKKNLAVWMSASDLALLLGISHRAVTKQAKQGKYGTSQRIITANGGSQYLIDITHARLAGKALPRLCLCSLSLSNEKL